MSTEFRLLLPNAVTAVSRGFSRAERDWQPSPRFRGPIDPARTVPRPDLKHQDRSTDTPVPGGASTGGRPRRRGTPAPKRPSADERIRALLQQHAATHPGAGLTSREIATACDCAVSTVNLALAASIAVQQRRLTRRLTSLPGGTRIESRLVQDAPWPAPVDGWAVIGGGV